MMTLEPIIRESIRTGASDIHLSVGIPPILRIHGKLEKVGNYNLTAEDTESLANELLNEEEMEFFEEEGEIDVAYTFLEICRYRVIYECPDDSCLATVPPLASDYWSLMWLERAIFLAW